MAASTSFYPTVHPSGAFSPLQDLIRAALREDSESSPDVMMDQDQLRFLGYANRVVEDVNRHPVFKDLLEQTKPTSGVTCSATAGDGEITIAPLSNGTTVQFLRNTPIRIRGAGAGGGDLITAILGDPDTGTIRIADAVDTTVTAAQVTTVYSTRIKRYTSITDIREIDDIVMIDGLKYMDALDDRSDGGVNSAQIRRTIYEQARNAWFQDLVGMTTGLEIDQDYRDWDV